MTATQTFYMLYYRSVSPISHTFHFKYRLRLVSSPFRPAVIIHCKKDKTFVVFLWQNLHKFRNHRAEGPEFAKVDRDGMVI